MKVLVFSDTHHQTDLLTQALLEHRASTDLILHLGDCCYDTALIRQLCPEIACVCVSGNCDPYPTADFPSETVVPFGVGGFRAFLCHGHRYGASDSTDLLYAKGRNLRVNAVLFGHTHVAHIEERDGILLFNPGSSSLPRGTEPPSYGVLTVDENGILPLIRYQKSKG